MSWYREGTVAIGAGQTTVTGTNTAFAANCRVGDEFKGPDGRGYEVVNVASDTVLSILPPWQGDSVAGAGYSIVPIQGYPKDLADKFKEIVVNWGSVLALLGNATTLPQLLSNIEAAKSGVNSDITELNGLTRALTVAQGGTGGGTPSAARAALGLKSAAVADIVGAVSQVGGVPAGAIIESSSNANGGYIKFADGTLACWGSSSTALTASVAVSYGFQSPGVASFTFPVAFAASPVVTPQFLYRSGAPAQAWGNLNTLSPTGITLVAQSFSSGGAVYPGYFAIGRWY